MATNYLGTTEGAVFVPQVWSPILLESLKDNLVMASRTADFSSMAKGKGDTVVIPVLPALTANPFVQGNPITAQTATAQAVSLVIDKHNEASVYVGDSLSLTSQYDLIKYFVSVEGAYAIAAAFDADLIAEGVEEADNSVQAVGHTGDDLLKDFLEVNRYLNEAGAPQKDRVMVITPAIEARLMTMEQATSALFNSTDSAIVNGRVTRFMGFEIAVSNQPGKTEGSASTEYFGLAFHKNALGYALANASGPEIQMQYVQSMQATLVTARLIYGVKALRPEHIVTFSITE